MSIITIATPFNIDLEFRAAPFHRRMFAWLIDFVVLCLFNWIVLRFLIAPFEEEESMQVMYLLFSAIPSYFYHLLMEQFMNGQSFGKKAMKLKVISLNGDEPTLSQYLLRWFLGLGNIILLALPYLILMDPASVIVALMFYLPDVLAIAITTKGTRLGDMAAGTVLIDSRRQTQIGDTIYLEIEDTEYQVMFPDVMKLTDRDINGIRNLLDVRNQSKDTYLYMAKIAERIKEVLGLQTNLDPESLMRQLLKDYNHLTRK